MTHKLSIRELTDLFKRKKLSPVDHTQAIFDRIKKLNPDIRAFTHLSYESAMKEAKQAEEDYHNGIVKSPLQGITVGVKDVVYTKDSPVTLETELYYEHESLNPGFDATGVVKLREAGAIIIGKTNTHEMGMGPTGDVGYSGHAKNPHNLNKVSGGSSSGSGAAIAAGLCDLALGTDTGGSVRLPSTMCGIVGMKPQFGRVSNFGMTPLSYSCDSLGPMTRTVEDNALALQVMSGYDPKDMYSLDVPVPDFTSLLGESIEGMVLGVPYTWLEERLDEEMKASTLKAIEQLKNLGMEVIDITDGLLGSRAELDSLRQSHQLVLISDGYHAHRKELSHPGKFAQVIYNRLLTGNNSSLDYIAAFQRKGELQRIYQNIYNKVDVILTPGLSLPACDLYQTELEVQGEKNTTMKWYTEYTWIDSFTGFPSLALPTAYNQEGSPLGVLINGPKEGEAKIYQVASALEKALGLRIGIE